MCVCVCVDQYFLLQLQQGEDFSQRLAGTEHFTDSAQLTSISSWKQQIPGSPSSELQERHSTIWRILQSPLPLPHQLPSPYRFGILSNLMLVSLWNDWSESVCLCVCDYRRHWKLENLNIKVFLEIPGKLLGCDRETKEVSSFCRCM